MAFNGAGPAIPGNVAALAQGQQPILNVGDHNIFCGRFWS
jgi:hypothetical protein